MRFRQKALILALCAALLLPAASPAARADEALSSLIESPVGRFLLTETSEGSGIVSRILGHGGDSSSLRELSSRLEEPGMEDIRTELHDRLTRAQELVRERRAASEAGDLELAPEDRILLREMASRELQLASGDGEAIEFVSPDGDSASLASNSERFLEPGPEDPASEPADSSPDAETETRARRKASDWVKDMRQCLRDRPPAARRTGNLRYLLTGLGISEAFTAGGYILGSGQKVMNVKDLTSEMIMTAVTSVVGTRLLTGNATFLVRWFRTAAWGVGRATIDGVYYYITPLKDTHGRPVAQATEERYGYNVGWNLSTSLIPVSMYYLVSGLECLYPGATGTTIGTGARIVMNAATSWAYYNLRSHIVGE